MLLELNDICEQYGMKINANKTKTMIMGRKVKKAFQLTVYSSGRQHSLKCAKGKRSRPVCPIVQQEEVESIPASSYECTMVHCVLRGTMVSQFRTILFNFLKLLNLKRDCLSFNVKLSVLNNLLRDTQSESPSFTTIQNNR
ncbi:hypothetical protein ANN_09610 [Periplaneta americana]|uniref:Reverse transcriptase domain-containing protein n=1 Tax=Periplaneta americana TaxID=6978 RepID=A0ABQ8TP17_PERAM|nr:hypothetical protein ANN_09610 [Periplaneta americana]